jgi:hypothetical protein
LYEQRPIRKQDTKDDTFDPFEDKDQSTPNHFNFRIAKYIYQTAISEISFFFFFFFFFFSLSLSLSLSNNYAATFEFANYTTRNGNRQRTNVNENGIQI